MAATITATGTWTAITGLRGQDARINQPSISDIDLEDLKNDARGVILPELQSFIQAAADGYSLRHWQAAGLIEVLLKAYMNSEGPTQQNRYTP